MTHPLLRISLGFGISLLLTVVGPASPPPGDLSGDPRLDFLKDAFITSDGANGYYLTGTAASLDRAGKRDFDYNRGAPLWHSTDLEAWTPRGFAWDRVAALAAGRPKIGAWLEWGVPAERMDGLLAQATTTPRLYQHKGDWFLLCAMNSQNVLLQKSSSGKAEGPYEDFAVLVTRGPAPSFLTTSSGEVFLLFADGWIARMEPSLEKLAEAPRPLTIATKEPGDHFLTVGGRGVAAFEHNGKYHVLAPRWTVRDGKSSHDAVLWSADSPYGPYTETDTVLIGSGPVSVFQKSDTTWQAVSALPLDDGRPRIIPFP